MAPVSYARRAAAGAALLDAAVPGWAARIDLARLDQSSATSCVLGQLYDDPGRDLSGYLIGLDALTSRTPGSDNGWKFAVEHGFTPYGYEPDLPASEANAGLNAAWAAEIRARRDGGQDYSPPAARHTDMLAAVTAARSLTAPGEYNAEYVRGQAELICDLYGYDTGTCRDLIMELIAPGSTAGN